MLCEKILGTIDDSRFKGCLVDEVEMEWHEAFKKLHKKKSKKGRDIGIRLDNDILVRGLREGDVIGQEGEEIIAVKMLPCEVIVIEIASSHPDMVAKVCYEIGNKHASLLWGEHQLQFITPYNEPTMHLLKHLHGVTVKKEMQVLDFDQRISASINAHTH